MCLPDTDFILSNLKFSPVSLFRALTDHKVKGVRMDIYINIVYPRKGLIHPTVCVVQWLTFYIT